jgi:hypothetical protein
MIILLNAGQLSIYDIIRVNIRNIRSIVEVQEASFIEALPDGRSLEDMLHGLILYSG